MDRVLKKLFFDWKTKQWSIKPLVSRIWFAIPWFIFDRNVRDHRYYIYKDRSGAHKRSEQQPFLGLIVEYSEEGQAIRWDWWRCIKLKPKCKHDFFASDDKYQVEICNSCGLPKYGQ